MHISCRKYLVNACLELTRSCLDVGTCIELHAKCLCHILLCAKEACCNQDNICRHLKFTSGDLCHIHTTGLWILLCLQLHKLHLLELAVLVCDKLLYGCLIDSRIMSEYRNRFFLAVIGLADSRPLRPRIGCCSLIRKLWHHLKLRYGFCALTDCCSDTVVSGITATDDDNMFALCINPALFLAGKDMLGGARQKIYRKIDSLCFSTLCLDITRIGCATGEDHTVVFLHQICCLNVFSDICVDNKLHALFFHNLLLAVNNPLLQLHVRNTVHQKASDMIISLIYRNGMTAAVKLIGCCQSGRTGTDDCNLFAGSSLWRLRPHQVVGITVLDDRILICLAGNRCIVQTTGAGCLTECRAYSGGKLRKVICLTQHLQCLFVITMI